MGGKAFDNTRRIFKEEIPDTLKSLEYQTGMTNLSLLGSAGKVPDSGDLDLNIDNVEYDFDDVQQLLEQFVEPDNIRVRKANDQIFISFPIYGTTDRVQIDFMFGNAKWQDFSYFSAGRGVDAGIYRTELLKALTNYKSLVECFEGGELIAVCGPSFLHSSGITWRCRHRPYALTGPKRRIKALKIIELDEFNNLYGNASLRDTIADPELAKNWLLPDHPSDGFDTFTDVWSGIRNHYNRFDSETIKNKFLDRLNSLRHDPIKEILDIMG